MFYLDIIFSNDKTFITYEKSYYIFLQHSLAYSFIKHIDLDTFLLKSYNYIFILMEYLIIHNNNIEYYVPSKNINILNVNIDPNISINNYNMANTNIKLIDNKCDLDYKLDNEIKHTRILMSSTINI